MLKFDEQKHIYTFNEKVVPSVTQILNRVGVRADENSPWGSVSGGDFMINEVASRFGKEFHKAAAARVIGQKFTYDPVMEPWINGLEKFLSDYQLYQCLVEVMGRSLYGYAGTMDVFCGYVYRDQKKRYAIIDWKTSTTLSKTSRLQTSSYEQIIREKHCIKNNIPIDRLTVRIFENGYEVDLRTKKHSTDWTQFLSILNIYKTFSKA
jgi:hypothetical protein